VRASKTAEPDIFNAMTIGYRQLLLKKHKADLRLTRDSFTSAFSEFTEAASDAVRIDHWDSFTDAIAAANPSFWNGYFNRFEEVYGQAGSLEQARRVVDRVRARLAAAGVGTDPALDKLRTQTRAELLRENRLPSISQSKQYRRMRASWVTTEEP
jgi:hypothetical protein